MFDMHLFKMTLQHILIRENIIILKIALIENKTHIFIFSFFIH